MISYLISKTKNVISLLYYRYEPTQHFINHLYWSFSKQLVDIFTNLR